MFRKTIFWTHLVCGVIAGLVIFSMSITGVLLTYERQINRWLAEQDFVSAEAQQDRMSLEQLSFIQQREHPDMPVSTLVIDRDPGAPVNFRAGRRGGMALNPYTGEEMETGSPGAESFFRSMTTFHRWFSIEGENRDIARHVTGVSNLAFLFLAISGLYLWFPSILKWTMFKSRLWFRKEYPNSKARDFHWHHIFGVWMAIPLIAIIYTGTMFYYPWARDGLFAVLGIEQPAGGRGGPGGGPGGRGNNAADAQVAGSAPAQTASFLSLDQLVERAINETDRDWNTLSVTLPEENQDTVEIQVDWGNGAQAHKRHTLSMDRSSGELLAVSGYDDMPAYNKARGIQRFLHTGELWGFWGQTLAGLASLAALFMVWTGFALSWRRLIVPLLEKRRKA